ncbi:MAG TPA: hypothetical protein VGF10_12785 [Gaiella sp.]
MSPARLLCVVLAAAAAWVVAPDVASAAQFPTPSCNGGGCSDGWYRSNVTVSWSFDPGYTGVNGCDATTITEDTGGATLTCTVTYGTGGTFNSVTVRKDSSPPSVNASFARDPDSNGWYTSPVGVSFTGDGGPSGISSCTSGTYGGPDGGDVAVTGSCTDGAGNTGSTTERIKYDASAPTVTPAPERAPDTDGWYNHPVKVAFSGQDGGSGVAECTAPVTYAGPDGNPAKIVGQCRDAVGHLSAPVAFELRYDHTKPTRPVVKARRTSGGIAVSWKAPTDAVRAEVRRAPGGKGKQPAVVFAGKGVRVVDHKARAPSRYWYEVRVYDQAGNAASRTLAVQPSTGILLPVGGAVVKKAPLVRWVPVAKARFYNVQLWRGREKLLTTWPSETQFRLGETWKFGGRTQRLGNGKYQVYVWPAFGTLAKPQYGKLVGRADFVVKRR